MLQITSKPMLIHDVSPKNQNLNIPKSPNSQKVADLQKETSYIPLKNYILKTKKIKHINSSFKSVPIHKSQIKENSSSNPLDFLLVAIIYLFFLIINRSTRTL